MTLNRNRLNGLRSLIAREGGYGFPVPRTDAFQGEYVAPCDERLAWLTGFTGSAGLAIVLLDKAALFVDGRYTLQAQNQVDQSLYEIYPLTNSSPWEWLGKNLKKGHKILYDPWLVTVKEHKQVEGICGQEGASFVPVLQNLVDQLWEDRPFPPSKPVKIHDITYAGVTSQAKRENIVQMLKDRRVDGVLLTACDSVAWLLNIRGDDVPHTPVAQGFALLWADTSIDLFIHPAKITVEVKNHLGPQVRIHDFAVLEQWLHDLKGHAILTDPGLVPVALLHNLKNCQAIEGADPCILPKSLKNPAEIAGAQQAHLQDGIAVTRFLAWLSAAAPDGNLTEMDAVEKLLSFRQEGALFTGSSFPTISAAGAHGAIVHYQATPATNRILEKGSLYLVDSGGQYLNGTTDVTRTVGIGTPIPEQKDRFTRVLKGHIALATTCFPKGVTGSQLDALARHSLWQAGLDYEHGTGHGVGSFLSVHEGPQRISKTPSTIPLQPGMIVSNEPGYYKKGEYGIRIESLLLVVEKGTPPGGELALLGFETLTLAPVDVALIEEAMLSAAEKEWINGYHKSVYAALAPCLNAKESDWLRLATREIKT